MRSTERKASARSRAAVSVGQLAAVPLIVQSSEATTKTRELVEKESTSSDFIRPNICGSTKLRSAPVMQ